MPLERFKVRNEYGLGQPELYQEADVEDPKAVLNGVSVAGLVGILRQLGDLAEFAAEVFRGIQEQVTTTASRSQNLILRARSIEAALPSLEKAVLSQTSHLHFAYTAGREWHPCIENVQNHFIYNDLPRFIMDSYEDCCNPPCFHLLDKFHTGGPGSCLKSYSDPTFFQRASAGLIRENDEKVQRDKKGRKHKKKKFQKSRGTSRSASTSHHTSSVQRTSRTVGTHTSSRTASISGSPLKSLTPANSGSLHSRSASGIIEHVYHPSPSIEPDEKLSKESSSRFMQHGDIISSALSNDQSSIFEDNSPSRPSGEQADPGSFNEKVDFIGIKDHCISDEAMEMLEINFGPDTPDRSNVRSAGRAQILSGDVDTLQEIPSKSKPREFDERQKFESQNRSEGAQVTENALETEQETDSEQENYVDAPNTIQSESENDLDYQRKEVQQISCRLGKNISEEVFSSDAEYGTAEKVDARIFDNDRPGIYSGSDEDNRLEEVCGGKHRSEDVICSYIDYRISEEVYLSDVEPGRREMIYASNVVNDSSKEFRSCNVEIYRQEEVCSGSGGEDRPEEAPCAHVEGDRPEVCFSIVDDPRLKEVWSSNGNGRREDIHPGNIDEDRLRKACSNNVDENGPEDAYFSHIENCRLNEARSSSNGDDRREENYSDDIDEDGSAMVHLNNVVEDGSNEVYSTNAEDRELKEDSSSNHGDYRLQGKTAEACQGIVAVRVEEVCSSNVNDREEDIHFGSIDDRLICFSNVEEYRSGEVYFSHNQNCRMNEALPSSNDDDIWETDSSSYIDKDRLRDVYLNNVKEDGQKEMYSSDADDNGLKEVSSGSDGNDRLVGNLAEACYGIEDATRLDEFCSSNVIDRSEVIHSGITDDDKQRKVCSINVKENRPEDICCSDVEVIHSGITDNDKQRKLFVKEDGQTEMYSSDAEDNRLKEVSSDSDGSDRQEGNLAEACYGIEDATRLDEFCSSNVIDRSEVSHSGITDDDKQRKVCSINVKENRPEDICCSDVEVIHSGITDNDKQRKLFVKEDGQTEMYSSDAEDNRLKEVSSDSDGSDRQEGNLAEACYGIDDNTRLDEFCSSNVTDRSEVIHSGITDDDKQRIDCSINVKENRPEDTCCSDVEVIRSGITDDDKQRKVCSINVKEDRPEDICCSNVENGGLDEGFSSNKANDRREKGYSGSKDEGNPTNLCSSNVEEQGPKVHFSDAEDTCLKEVGSCHDDDGRPEGVSGDLVDTAPEIVYSVGEFHATSDVSTNEVCIPGSSDPMLLKNICNQQTPQISKSQVSNLLSSMGLPEKSDKFNRLIGESVGQCASELNCGTGISDPQSPSDESVGSGMCKPLESGAEVCRTKSVSIWTNGGLLGLEPSKPPVFAVPSPASQDGLPMEKLDKPRENSRSFQNAQSAGYQNLPLPSASPPPKRETTAGSQLADRSGNANGNASIVFPNIGFGIQGTKNGTAGSYQASEETLYGVFGLSHRFLMSSFRGSVPQICNDVKPAPTGVKNEIAEVGNEPYGQQFPVSLSGDLLGHDSFFDSPPISPPLEHMKISLNPLNCFESSKLKLKIPDGAQCQEINRGVFFPSFQLVPECGPQCSVVDYDSDDDTFCRSSLYKSDDCPSAQSESNSDGWEANEISDAFEFELFSATRTIPTPDSVPSSGLVGQIADSSIYFDGEVKRSTYIENSTETPLYGAFLDLPSFDVVNPTIEIGIEDCFDSKNVQKLQDYIECFPLPPPGPSMHEQVAGLPSNGLVDQGLHSQEFLKQTFDQSILISAGCDKPQQSVVDTKQNAEAVATTSIPGGKIQLKMNWHKEVRQSVSGDEMEKNDDFLQQIRTQQSNLRCTVSAAPTVPSHPTPSAKVNAILEKANWIRQAVGSDNGEDHGALSDA